MEKLGAWLPSLERLSIPGEHEAQPLVDLWIPPEVDKSGL